MVRAELFKICTDMMIENNTDDAHFDTLCIFQDVLGEKNPMFSPRAEISQIQKSRILELTQKRCEGFPLQYLLGEWEFWGFPVKVGNGVLIPRPDTETLVEEVLKIAGNIPEKHLKIADLCSGSGCIAIALKKELPDSDVFALELSDEALGFLRKNAEINNCSLHILKADVLDPDTADRFPDFDIIVSNPPYLSYNDLNSLMREVKHEPQEALDGGRDGLDYYKKMTPIWKNSLKSNGFLCYEFGMDQHCEVEKILVKNGFSNLKFQKDAGGIIRTVTAQRR